jgi:hypothetical protein
MTDIFDSLPSTTIDPELSIQIIERYHQHNCNGDGISRLGVIGCSATLICTTVNGENFTIMEETDDGAKIPSKPADHQKVATAIRIAESSFQVFS